MWNSMENILVMGTIRCLFPFPVIFIVGILFNKVFRIFKVRSSSARNAASYNSFSNILHTK